MTVTTDLLAGARWWCAATEPSSSDSPAGLPPLEPRWLAARVPGTAAGAVRDADGPVAAEARDYDAEDWWFRTSFEVADDSAGPWKLTFDGLATISDVWLNGEHIHRGESMFTSASVTVEELGATNELVVRCGALAPLLAEKRPRPRWRTRLVEPQNLRWFRTSVLGRMPGWDGTAAPVGPWRPITLTPHAPVEVVEADVRAHVDGFDGVVELDLLLRRTSESAGLAVVTVGEVRAEIDVPAAAGEVRVRATITVPDAPLWWPHTHGAQPLHSVSVSLDGIDLDLGSVGFRTITVDRADDGFTVAVNGVPIFCRGACWTPLDPIDLAVDDEAYTTALTQVVDAGMNMVRLTGTTVYEAPAFWDSCDRLGVLVWQDAMLATLDPPEDASFLAALDAEITELARSLQTHPSLAVASGGSETEQQATMFGLDTDRRRILALEQDIPTALGRVLPELPYVTSTPSGGDLPTHSSRGVAHYFGVGGYRRPLDDARRAGVRFAAECLAFSIPPERSSTAALGSAVPRDNGASWDFADVTDFYVDEAFGIAPSVMVDERRLDLRRAAVAHVMTETMAEWRRPGSTCDGALVLSLRDLAPGAGWGLVDSTGRPKAPWFALRRMLAPRAAFVTDEGLDGLAIHVVNDSGSPLDGRLEIELFGLRGNVLDEIEHDLHVDAHGSLDVSLDGLLGAFRDVNHSYKFGEPAYDAARVRLLDADGGVSDETRLVRGQRRDRTDEVGLTAAVTHGADERWTVEITTRELAQWVSIDVPGFVPSDSWFHLVPGAVRTVDLTPVTGAEGAAPCGFVRALNAHTVAVVAAPVAVDVPAAVAS